MVIGLIDFTDSSYLQTFHVCVYLSVCSIISGRVLVYGSSLSAYCCVQYLLEQVGLAGERITLVLPHTAACFNNPEVEKQVQKAIATSGEGLSIIYIASYPYSV